MVLLVFIMPTDVHCDFMYASFPLSPRLHRVHLLSHTPGAQFGLCLYQIAIWKFPSSPATKELQPLNTPLLAHNPQQEFFKLFESAR